MENAVLIARQYLKQIRSVVLVVARKFIYLVNQSFQDVSYLNFRLVPYYYAIASPRFRREQYSVLSGIRSHREQNFSRTGNAAELRRNIHRLEKGLLMRPRRVPFALEYIAETMKNYEKQLTASKADGTDIGIIWAHDVLKRYFEISPCHDVMNSLREQFQNLPSPRGETVQTFVPYRRDLSGSSAVSYGALLSLAKRRRSVRWFVGKRVPRAHIEEAIAIAAQAPSACNRQPFLFRVFDDPTLVQKIISVPMGTAGYAENVPAVAVVIGQLRNFAKERDRHLIYIDGGLAAMSFAFALETLNLASCLINWPDIEEREVRMADLMRLERDERPVMLIAFGYPDPNGLVAASAKKDIHEILRYNFE